MIADLEMYPGYKITVYNRYGNEVFSTTDYHNDWDGRNQSKVATNDGYLPDGTYFYVIELGNGQKPIQDYLQIQR